MRTTDAALADLTNDGAIIEQAAKGVTLALDEVVRRYGAAAWQLAVAITGDVDLALEAMAEGTARVLTAVNAERIHRDAPFRPHLLLHVRNAALDAVPANAPTSIDSSLLAGALADVPERWRSALWLSVVTHCSIDDVALVLGMDRVDAEALLARARMGVRQRYLAAHLTETGDRNCSRAVARLGAFVDGSLNAVDRDKVERHLGLCDGCTTRRDLIGSLPADLAALVPPMPGAARDRVRAAIVPVAASAVGRTGMSERTEKMLAGISAFAAAVGVLGAAVLGLGEAADRQANLAVAPVAPLVSEVITPTAGVDLQAAAAFTSGALPRRGRASSGSVGSGISTGAVSAVTNSIIANSPTLGPDMIAATDDGPSIPGPNILDRPDSTDPDGDGGGDDSTVIGITVPVADIPVAIEIGPDDQGLTVGPVSIGSQPDPADSSYVNLSAPVVDAVEAITTDGSVAAITDVLGG